MKRWGYDSNGYFGRETPDGKYVLYTDAVKMQREAFVEGGSWQEANTSADGSDFATLDDRIAEATRFYKEE